MTPAQICTKRMGASRRTGGQDGQLGGVPGFSSVIRQRTMRRHDPQNSQAGKRMYGAPGASGRSKRSLRVAGAAKNPVTPSREANRGDSTAWRSRGQSPIPVATKDSPWMSKTAPTPNGSTVWA